MGRNQRDRATFAFKSKKISMYKPTQGQAASFALAARSAKGAEASIRMAGRFFAIIESLVVRKPDWEWLEEQLITGASDIPDYGKLINDVFSYEWPEAEAEPEDETGDGGE